MAERTKNLLDLRNADPSYSVDVLDRTIRRYRKPVSILSDHGSTFYAGIRP